MLLSVAIHLVKDMEDFTHQWENTLFNSSSEAGNSFVVPELAKELELYKISQFLLNYSAVPLTVWGWSGNFFSFR